LIVELTLPLGGGVSPPLNEGFREHQSSSRKTAAFKAVWRWMTATQ
jgi:hypothetical protein